MKPILKWTGGKRKLVPTLIKYLPKEYDNEKTVYIEPFVGGGALFFHLEPENAVISDTNWQLINFYKQVRDHPLELLKVSDQHLNEKDYYLEIRNWDRKPKEEQAKISLIDWAARFLYLNKTAYSGMWRVNQKNQMNVPFANYASARLFNSVEKYADLEHLLVASELLKRTEIHCSSYNNFKEFNLNDFVYLDPPYDDTWTGYTAEGFNKFSQEELCDYTYELDADGIHFLLSNNSTPHILDLYQDMEIISVKSGQSIRGRHDTGVTRDVVTEVLVRNYE